MFLMRKVSFDCKISGSAGDFNFNAVEKKIQRKYVTFIQSVHPAESKAHAVAALLWNTRAREPPKKNKETN